MRAISPHRPSGRRADTSIALAERGLGTMPPNTYGADAQSDSCSRAPEDSPWAPLLGNPFAGPMRLSLKELVGVLVAFTLSVISIVVIIVIVNPHYSKGGNPEPHMQLVNRTVWGARPANGSTPRPVRPATHVVVIHTVTDQCLGLEPCCALVRGVQDLHMDSFHFADIGYSFLVGGDGRTYEGRGWDTEGAFSHLLNTKALGIAFIGDFEYTVPTPQQIAEAQVMLQEAVKLGKLASDYKLVGHRQVADTLSPGQELFDILKTWPHWEQCYMDTC